MIQGECDMMFGTGEWRKLASGNVDGVLKLKEYKYVYRCPWETFEVRTKAGQ